MFYNYFKDWLIEYSVWRNRETAIFIAWPYVQHLCALVWPKKRGLTLIGNAKSGHIVMAVLFNPM